MTHFRDDDAGYRRWLDEHPDGFVINTYAKPSARYLKLHCATCPSISRLQAGAKTFTEGEYSKITGGQRELEEHARSLGGSVDYCPICLGR
jgi:4-hydroxy-3-methylbut-2-enyl diphosphate reductase IspH